MPKYTKTEQQILKLLSDGRRHTKDELKELLTQNNLNMNAALNMHITRIRKKLQPIGEDLICEFSARRIHYRHVRLISYQ